MLEKVVTFSSFQGDDKYILYITRLINTFSGSLVNAKFLNLKLNVFTGFICSTEYVKQVVLINPSWIPTTLLKTWGLEFCLFSKK